MSKASASPAALATFKLCLEPMKNVTNTHVYSKLSPKDRAQVGVLIASYFVSQAAGLLRASDPDIFAVPISRVYKEVLTVLMRYGAGEALDATDLQPSKKSVIKDGSTKQN